MCPNNINKELITKRVNFAAKSGRFFDNLSINMVKYLGVRQKYSYQRIPDKIMHYLYDISLRIQHGARVRNIGNAFQSLVDDPDKFDQHPIHRCFFYDKKMHALVGTATGIDINVSQGKHHLLELNRSIGILEIIRPIYKTKYGPEIYNIVKFAKKYGFRKVYVMYSRLHLYRQECINASKEFGIELIPVSYPWVEFDKTNYDKYFMPDQLESDTLYMRLEPGYSPVMHFLSDKYVSYQWLHQILDKDRESYSYVNIPETSNTVRINKELYSERWPNLVVKLSGKMQGQAIAMLKADSDQKAMTELKISNVNEIPPLFKSSPVDRVIDTLFGLDKTVIYQDFVQPKLRDGKAGRIRINVFANPLDSISLSDYYMWTVFNIPEKCPDGLLKDPRPYIVNWSYSGKKAQFAELTADERKETDPAIPQICKLIQTGLMQKFKYSNQNAD